MERDDSLRTKMKSREENEESDDEMLESDDEDETIARIQRAHFAASVAMNPRRRSAAKPRAMSHKRKLEAVKTFHDFTKKLKKDTGISLRSLMGNNILELSDFSSEGSESDSDGLSEEEFVVNPNAVEELNEENESYIDPETGDIIEPTKKPPKPLLMPDPPKVEDEPKTLSISDLINDGDLDLSKNVEIAEVEGSEICPDKTTDELLSIKQEENSQDFDISDKLVKMNDVDNESGDKKENIEEPKKEDEKKSDLEDDKKNITNALNVRRNIREVMDEKNLDASTLAAQRQESERLARVQEQQRIIREVQRQIALNRQNKMHQKTISLLQGGSSILKKALPGQKLNLPNTVLVKLPSGEIKKTTLKSGQVEVSKLHKASSSGSAQKFLKSDQKGEKKEVVEIVSSSSGEESTSSSSDSDDCIMLSDSEVPPSPEAEEDPGNSGLHVNDAYNLPDEQGRVLINIGHPENEEDIFLAPQIARIIKPHQIGGVRFLFDNIIESVERFSTSTGFGCILAHSMGLGKTLQIVCFCDIFLRHTSSKTVLCIMPINTLQNWVAEFNMWLPPDASCSPLAAHGPVRARSFPIYVLNDSHKTLQMRARVVKDWKTTGGVLMIGYELYRLLSMKKDKKPRKKKKAELKAEAQREREKEREKEDKKSDKPDINNDDTQGSDNTMQSKLSEESKIDKDDGDTMSKDDTRDDMKKEDKKEDTPCDEDKKLLDEMYEALVRPGPDLVICDEGHRIKNSHSNISYALKQMRTKRRVVLTGYPLQNNLLEYWCMVDFVRPNYLGSKTEFCNMFERPIQNGQCIDSTPQDIRLMRYRAHVLHSLLVGFVQRRSHAVLQSTLPQKEEYVLLVRMTPLQRKLYDRFMNEVVRSTSVPNPLKAFAICCKIWNHPDVLYNFLKKRSEVNAAVEEDLDLEEIGGVTKAGRAKNSKAQPRKGATKTRASSKKPAATIQPNTAMPPNTKTETNNYGNPPYPPNASYNQQYRQDQPSGSYPPYQGQYPNQDPGYYPPEGYNQNYGSNFYPQQQQYPNNYPNQYPQNNQEGYNQNYWNNSNYYGNSNYYNNPQYQNNQTSQAYRNTNPGEYNNSQQYPPNFVPPTNDPNYRANAIQPYQNSQEGFGNQQRPPYPQSYQQSGYQEYNSNATPGPSFPNQQQPFPDQPYPSNYPPNQNFNPGGTTFNQYENGPPNYPGYSNNISPTQTGNSIQPEVKSETSVSNYPTEVKTEAAVPPSANPYNSSYDYNQSNVSAFPTPAANINNYPGQYPNYPQQDIKPPMGSAGSESNSMPWPLPGTLKTELDKIKAEDKVEKSESDGEVKIADLDTKKIVKDESKKEKQIEMATSKVELINKKNEETKEAKKSDQSESEDESPKKGKKGKRKEKKKTEKPKAKGKGSRAKSRKERKTSKEKGSNTDSEESEKEEKPNREEELAMVKKAEEVTYDWAAELLKDYIPGIIENSAKMELFFYILNESIKLGDRILLFSQSLFTLNLIEDYLERNYIPGTPYLWERNKSYYRLDGSTHALEREKLINEFNTNPHIHLFLVSTRAGSLGINLVGANRVIVFDASWNPCHDTQAVCRVYRYGQKKPCFVYRFVMDFCLEKKIYDRQINKQGMADRVVDECNPDAVLSMKEITNLCFDNDEKETEIKDLSVHKDKYLDVVMQGILVEHGRLLSKEPFQHESLLVDRKEKKLSSAEKRLAKRGYELEKKAALAPKPTAAYRTVRAADGSVVQRPVASVRPMQHAARWIPADVWRRQGMTAQEMTLPLDVVIPTNSAEKTNIVLKAGQRVMVLKSPKGIYMQLESGKIIAIKTSLKGLAGAKGGDAKDNAVGKKTLTSRPSSAAIPGSLKNNSAITITSKSGIRPGLQRVLQRPLLGPHRIRPNIPGQKISAAELRNRMGELRSYSAIKSKISGQQGRLLRPGLPGSVSITKITKEPKKSDTENSDSNMSNKVEVASDEEPHVLDSDDEANKEKQEKNEGKEETKEKHEPSLSEPSSFESKQEEIKAEEEKPVDLPVPLENNDPPAESEPTSLVLTTDEKLPSEEALDKKVLAPKQDEAPLSFAQPLIAKETPKAENASFAVGERIERKINLLKNYRHQRQNSRAPGESSLSILERTASVLNKEGLPDFRKNLDDITQSYSPSVEEKPVTKSRKKRSPMKIDISESQSSEKPQPASSVMSHSVSSLLGPASNSTSKHMNEPMLTNPQPRQMNQASLPHDTHLSPLAHLSPMNQNSSVPLAHMSPMNQNSSLPLQTHLSHTGGLGTQEISKPIGPSISQSPMPINPMASPTPVYPAVNPSTDAHANPYGQYPGYGMPYGAYPNTPYYGGYGGAPYYAGYGASGTAPQPYPGAPPAPAPEGYMPPNPQW